MLCLAIEEKHEGAGGPRSRLPVSMTKARGGLLSGPCQLGHPSDAQLTNRALRGRIRAMGKETEREMVTGLRSAKSESCSLLCFFCGLAADFSRAEITTGSSKE